MASAWKQLVDAHSKPIDRAAFLGSMSVVYSSQGEQEKALQLLAKATSLLDEKSFLDLYDSIILTIRAGNISLRFGRTSEALNSYFLAQSRLEEIVGPNHINVGYIRNNICRSYLEDGRIQDALFHCEKALQIFLSIKGVESADAATGFNNRGKAYVGLGRLSEARVDLERALELRKKLFADGQHPHLAYSYHEMAALNLAEGKPKEALSFIQKAMEVWEKTLTNKDLQLAYSLELQGEILLKLRRNREAKKSIEGALAIYDSILPENHWRRGAARELLEQASGKVVAKM